MPSKSFKTYHFLILKVSPKFYGSYFIGEWLSEIGILMYSDQAMCLNSTLSL